LQAASSVRLTGAIEVRATLAKDTSTLAFTGRAQIDVTLSPGEVGVVPMTYQWTGTWGSCRWDAAGTDREVRVDYHGLVAGRPVAYISGSPPSVVVPCNDTTWGNSPVWRFNYEGQAAIEPLFNWFEIDDERGTGTFSLVCSSCRPPPASSYEVCALWHRSFNFSPTRPRPGKPVRVNERVVLLERSGIERQRSREVPGSVRLFQARGEEGLRARILAHPSAAEERLGRAGQLWALADPREQPWRPDDGQALRDVQRQDAVERGRFDQAPALGQHGP
jgi:hypothetical protein